MQILSLLGTPVAKELSSKIKEARKKGKSVSFGLLYGMGASKFQVYARDKYDVILSETEAEAFRTRFFNLYSSLLDWHDRQRRKVREMGYIRSPLGRMRRLPGIYSSNKMERAIAERQAINSPVQGFASDLTVTSALAIHQLPREYIRLVGTIHDAILMEVREDKVEEILPQVKHIMEHPPILEEFGVKVTVPIIAELTVGPWGAGKEFHVLD